MHTVPSPTQPHPARFQPHAPLLSHDPPLAMQAAIDNGWVSSCINDMWGNPTNRGIDKVLAGTSSWTCRNGQKQNQWFVLDLGCEMTVTAVRVRGTEGQSNKNPKTMRWQAGAAGGSGQDQDPAQVTWNVDPGTEYVFQGRAVNRNMRAGETEEEYDDWSVLELPHPVRSRWWRLWMDGNWGAHDYLHIMGFGIQCL